VVRQAREVEKLPKVGSERSGFDEIGTERLATFDELPTKLAALEETGATAERELKVLHDHRERLEDGRDRHALLGNYAHKVPDAFKGLAPEERHQAYRMLRLRAVVSIDENQRSAKHLGKRLGYCPTEAPYSTQ
jgi:hypothetical protein